MCGCSPERSIRLFEVLTRNRQSALGLSGRSICAREQTSRLCTIPPRQELSSPTWLAIRTWSTTRAIRVVTVVIIIIIVEKQTQEKLVLKNESKISLKPFLASRYFPPNASKSLVSYDLLITTKRALKRARRRDRETKKRSFQRKASKTFAEILYAHKRARNTLLLNDITSLHVSSLIRSVRDTIFAQIIIVSFTGVESATKENENFEQRFQCRCCV